MNKKKEEQLIQERQLMGTSYRNLASKYGISRSRAFRMVNQEELSNKPKAPVVKEEELPDDVAALKALLRKERLKNELLNTMIDIADRELGTNIRKKSGTRRSE